ncbi:MAG: hypothetical protein IJ225_01425 [Solobacterium sp.]|nr:hypothetical protein [Solobacterium sp.]
MKQYNVIIWGLGNVGRSALDHVLTKKELVLVGAYDVDPAKVGKDAGEIFGFETTGVIVSNDREAVMNTEADVVLYYAPQQYDSMIMTQEHMTGTCDEICELLSHGKNLITTCCMYHSDKLAPAIYKKIDDTAKAAGVTYVQQGIFPGLFNPYLPVVLGMGARRIESVTVSGGEPDELNTAPWAAMLYFGKTLEEADANLMNGINTRFLCDYGGTVQEIADRLGLDYDDYQQSHDIILSDRDYDTKNPLFGVVKKGTIGAHRLNMAVTKDGKEVVSFHFTHKASRNILPELDLDFKIDIKAENHVVANIEGFLPEYCDVFLTSAAPSVNLIPAVVAAEPGYKGALDVAPGYLSR